MKTTIALLLAAAVLAGCQTATQQRASHMSEVLKQTVAQRKACAAEAYNSPQAAPIRARLPMDPADATLAQLNSTDHASPDEIKSLYAVHDMIQPCRKATADELMTVTPTVVPILLDSYQESDTAVLSLINQQTTWGQYLQDQQREENIGKAKLIAELNRIQSDLQQSYQAEMQQRAQAAQAMANYLQTQQAINAINRPVYTNCTSFGNTTNCLTH
ncbi:hypothetical protein [Paraburkholderia sp. Cpub6]|uniref:hypothetical protein n=1 Tax=Paraburkholderia sp. Cpub6 TaxID=2723094 RepID=UPI001615D726|nr:hypothetical protein [Paraburkholderia sp. Cpub6]MBB5462848.1 hypothetical protein [Paraburkholderia sp. Cpub6]